MVKNITGKLVKSVSLGIGALTSFGAIPTVSYICYEAVKHGPPAGTGNIVDGLYYPAVALAFSANAVIFGSIGYVCLKSSINQFKDNKKTKERLFFDGF